MEESSLQPSLPNKIVPMVSTQSKWKIVREVKEENVPFPIRAALAKELVSKYWSDRPELRITAVEFIESRNSGELGLVVWFNEKVDEKIYWADECDPDLPKNKGKLILPFVMKKKDLKKGEQGLI